jgi:hypothetical protein
MRYLLLYFLLLCSTELYGQRTIVASGPMLEDRFPKKSGSLRASKFSIYLGKVKKNDVKLDTLFLYNEGNEAIRYTVYMHNTTSKDFPPHLSVSLKDSLILPGKESYLAIRYDARKIDDYGFVLDRCVLMTTDTETPAKQFSITAQLEDYFPPMTAQDSASVQRARIPVTVLEYGTIQAGRKASRTFTIYNDGQSELVIHKAKSNGPGITVQFSKSNLSPGDSSLATVEFSTFGKSGINNRIISIFMNDPALPEAKIQFNGTVAEGKKD